MTCMFSRRVSRVGHLVVAATLLAGCTVGQGHFNELDQDGTFYHVTDRAAGVWETKGAKDSRPCIWTRFDAPTGKIDDVLDSDQVRFGQVTRVTLYPDDYFQSYRCHPWQRVQ